MVLHLPDAEGGFGVTLNDITKHAALYIRTSPFVAWLGAFSQERQDLWLPNDDRQDASSWSSPPLVLLRDIHANLLTRYDCKKGFAPFQSQAHVGARGVRSSQDGVSQQQGAAPLFVPQFNRRGEDTFFQEGYRHTCDRRHWEGRNVTEGGDMQVTEGVRVDRIPTYLRL
jgi:hypothetical protein